ncbi:MAG: hypothetical protein KDH88_13425 [Chromatiales bacterium]|nr:hypothetical protein [Chromatiales bacterium]
MKVVTALLVALCLAMAAKLSAQPLTVDKHQPPRLWIELSQGPPPAKARGGIQASTNPGQQFTIQGAERQWSHFGLGKRQLPQALPRYMAPGYSTDSMQLEVHPWLEGDVLRATVRLHREALWAGQTHYQTFETELQGALGEWIPLSFVPPVPRSSAVRTRKQGLQPEWWLRFSRPVSPQRSETTP